MFPVRKYARLALHLMKQTLIEGEGLFVDQHLPNGQALIPAPGGIDRFIKVNGVNFHYVEYPADGPDVLMINGVGSSTYSWEKVAPLLQQRGYHVWAVDPKGFGWSDKPLGGDYDPATLMREVKTWMDAVELKKVICVGNSLGGGIAVLLSIDYPEVIERLVLIDAACYPQPKPLIVLLTALPGVLHFIKIFYGRWAMLWSLGEVFYHIDWVPAEGIEAYFTRNCTEGALAAQIKVARALDLKNVASYVERVPQVTAPALIIHGRDDIWVPLVNSQRFRRELSNSVLAVIPECGHAPQEEYPELTARLIGDFMEGKITSDPVVPVNPKGGSNTGV